MVLPHKHNNNSINKTFKTDPNTVLGFNWLKVCDQTKDQNITSHLRHHSREQKILNVFAAMKLCGITGYIMDKCSNAMSNLFL